MAGLEELAEKLTPYVKDIDPTLELEVRLLPRVLAQEWGGVTGWWDWKHRKLSIDVANPDVLFNDVLVSLAHEAGHIEQKVCSMSEGACEADAWRRGLFWAKKWGVVDNYVQGIRVAIRRLREWQCGGVTDLKALLKQLEK